MNNLDIIYKINYDPDRDFVRIKIKFIDFLKSIFNKQLKSKKFDETYNVNIPKNINKPQKIRLKNAGFEDLNGNKGDLYLEFTENNYDNYYKWFYEILSFFIIACCITGIFYCLIVPFEHYNYKTLASLCIFSFLSFFTTLKICDYSKNTYSEKFFNFITIHRVKIFLKNCFKYTCGVLFYLLLIYPLSMIAIWLLQKYSDYAVADFVVKYLPYSFEISGCKFCTFMVLLISLSIFTFINLVCEKKYYIGGFLGLILLYSFFDEQFFDKILGISGIIGFCAIGIVILMIIGAAGGSSDSSTSSSEICSSNSNNTSSSNKKKYKYYTRAYQYSPSMVRAVYQEGYEGEKYSSERSITYSGQLHSYTNSTVLVRISRMIYVYDIEGRKIDSYPDIER